MKRACLIGLIGFGLASSAHANDVVLTAVTGADGASVSLTSPAYSTEYSNPQAIPADGSLWVCASSSECTGNEHSSMQGSSSVDWLAGSASTAQVLGQPALYEDTVDIRAVPIAAGR